MWVPKKESLRWSYIEEVEFTFFSMDFFFWVLRVFICIDHYFFLKHLYWSIIALQWCVSFCFITNWISYMHTYIPISMPPPCVSLPPSLSHISRWLQSMSWSPCAMQLLPTSYFTFGSVYMSMLLSYFIPAYLPPPRVLKSILYVCVFIPVLPLNSSELLFF